MSLQFQNTHCEINYCNDW